METVVKLSNLKNYFKEVKAVDDISFQIQKGELFGFLGVHGAGKSTTINMLCTLFPPTEGQVEICGYRLGKKNEEIRRSIGVVCQNNSMDNRLSVRENLAIRGKLYERDSVKLRKKMDEEIWGNRAICVFGNFWRMSFPIIIELMRLVGLCIFSWIPSILGTCF